MKTIVINEPAPTRAEEWANSITHGIGAVLSVIGLPPFVAATMWLGSV